MGSRFSVVYALVVVAGVVGVLIWALGLVGYRDHRGFYAPVFDSEGTALYYFERRSIGIHYGLGWRNITPPTRVMVLADEVSLRRVRFDGRGDKAVHDWPASPLAGEVISAYRGNLFGRFEALLDARDPAALRYWARLTRPRDGKTYQVLGAWRAGQTGGVADWAALGGAVLAGEPPVAVDGWAPVSLPGPEGFPRAIVLYHLEDQKTRLVRSTEAFAAEHGGAVPLALVTPHLRKKR